MGRLIKDSASPRKIIKDLRTTIRRAEVAGGVAKEKSDIYLVPKLMSAEAILQRYDDAKLEFGNLSIDIRHAKRKADLTIGAIRDEIWNMLGRPKNNQTMDEIFFGGIQTYSRAKLAEQPQKMQMLENQIEFVTNSALTDENRTLWIKRIRTSRLLLSEAMVPLSKISAEKKLASEAYDDVGPSARKALLRFKRALLNEGLSETQIHRLIPDRK